MTETSRCPVCHQAVRGGHACSTVPAVDHRGRLVVPIAPKSGPVVIVTSTPAVALDQSVRLIQSQPASTFGPDGILIVEARKGKPVKRQG